MASLSKNFIAGLLIFGFFGVVLFSLQFIKPIDVDSFANYKSHGHTKKKVFTRAMNCRCLPGNIPRMGYESYYCHNLSDSSVSDCY